MALLQAYTEAIRHSEEETFQTQPPSQQYCYRYLDDANRTFNEVIYCECVYMVPLCVIDTSEMGQNKKEYNIYILDEYVRIVRLSEQYTVRYNCLTINSSFYVHFI